MENTYTNPRVKRMLEIAQKNMNISKIKKNEDIIITKEEKENGLQNSNELFLSDKKF